MNCKKCNAPLSENDQFCKNCGTPVNEANNQNYGQFYNGYNQSPQKNNVAKYAIFGGVGVVVVVAIVIVVGMLTKDNNSLDQSNNNGNQNSGITQTGNNKSSYKVSLKGFEFSIPDNLVYEVNSQGLLIADKEDTWVANLDISQGSFTQLESKMSQLQALVQSQGLTSSAAQKKVIGGVQYIALEVSSGGDNAIIAYAEVNPMYIASISAVSASNEFDYSLFDDISKVISSATYSGATSNMEINANIDANAILELTK